MNSDACTRWSHFKIAVLELKSESVIMLYMFYFFCLFLYIENLIFYFFRNFWNYFLYLLSLKVDILQMRIRVVCFFNEFRFPSFFPGECLIHLQFNLFYGYWNRVELIEFPLIGYGFSAIWNTFFSLVLLYHCEMFASCKPSKFWPMLGTHGHLAAIN